MGFIMVYLCLLMTPQRSLGEDPPPSRDVSPRPSRWEAQRAMPRLRALETKGNCCRLQGLTELRSAVLGSYRYQEKHRKKTWWVKEILHHLGWLKPCKQWDKPSINWCRISFHPPYGFFTHPQTIWSSPAKKDFHHKKMIFTTRKLDLPNTFFPMDHHLGPG